MCVGFDSEFKPPTLREDFVLKDESPKNKDTTLSSLIGT